MSFATPATMLLLAFLIPAPLSTSSKVSARQGSPGSLETLSHKTGWIYLGALTVDYKAWFSSDPNVDYPTGAFEIVDRSVNRRKPVLPKIGEKIRLTTRVQVRILDYATRAEARRLTPLSSANRSLGPEDNTDAWIDAGTIVEVRAVHVSRPAGEIRSAWARVSPSPTK